MSEIERKSRLLLRESEIEDTLTSTTPGTVAAVISSALETADAITEPDEDFVQNHHHRIISTEDALTKSSAEDKLFLSNNNNLLNLDSVTTESLVSTLTSEYRLFDSSKRSFESGLIRSTGNVQRREDCDHQGILSRERNNADGNYVREIHEISSACSPFFSSKSTSMAENKETSNYYCGSSNGDKTFRDKSGNCEAHSVSHCKEKSTTDETISGNVRNIKPSNNNNKIELPESSSNRNKVRSANDHPSHQHHHHHHHHHHRSKDSKIPVGIAVAWQRLVTSSMSNPTASSLTTTRAESGGSAVSNQMHHNHQKGLNSESLSSTDMKNPIRPSSASPLLHKTHSAGSGKQSSSPSLPGSNHNFNYANGNSDKTSNSLALGRENSGNVHANISNRPLSACGEAMGGLVPFCPSSPITPSASPLSRPLPSSSVPPNLGYPSVSTLHHPQYPTSLYHRGPSYMEYPYGISGNSGSRPFAIPSPLSSPHLTNYIGNGQYWGGLGTENSAVPFLSPGIPNSPGAADYLQLTMQHQIHLHQQHLFASSRQGSASLSPSPSSLSSPTYNPYLPVLYSPDASSTSPKSPYYDHYIHQHNESIRQQHHHHQQQQQNLAAFSQDQLHQKNHQNSGINNGDNSCNNNINKSESNVVSTSNASGGSDVGYDLLANRNFSCSGGDNHHRTIPMVEDSPKSNIPLLSRSPTGGIRISTPTSTSSAAASAETTESAAEAATNTTTTAQAVIVTSASINQGCRSSTTTITQQQPSHQNSQSGSASASGTTTMAELSSSYSSASSPSPSFLLIHQQQHPHLFTSSSAALSPKSLTSSSTPSPVTVHDFNSGLNVIIGSSSSNNSNLTTSSSSSIMLSAGKCPTPSPISLTPRPLLSPFSSPFSPSPTPSGNNNSNNGSYKDLVWKEDGSIPKVKHIPGNAQGDEGNEESVESRGESSSSQVPTPLSSPLLRRTKHMSVPTPLSSPSSQKHDFKRLESLIERRDSESISPLVLIPQHSPATSTTSSVLDFDESRVLLMHGDGEPERKIIPAFHVPKVEEEEEDEEKISNVVRFDRENEENCMNKGSREMALTIPCSDSLNVKPQHLLIPPQPNHHLDCSDAKPKVTTAKVSERSEESSTIEKVKVESFQDANNMDTINCCDAINSNSKSVEKGASKKRHDGGQSGKSPILRADSETDNNDVPESIIPLFSNNKDNKDCLFDISPTTISFKKKNSIKQEPLFSSPLDDYSITTIASDGKDGKRKYKTKGPTLKIKAKKESSESRKRGNVRSLKGNANKTREPKTTKINKRTKCKDVDLSKNSKSPTQEGKKLKKLNKSLLIPSDAKDDNLSLKSKPRNNKQGPKPGDKGKGLLKRDKVSKIVASNISNLNKSKKKQVQEVKADFEKKEVKKSTKSVYAPKNNGNIEKEKKKINRPKKTKPMIETPLQTYQFSSGAKEITKNVITPQLATNETSVYHGSSVCGDKIHSVNSPTSCSNYNNNGDHNGSLKMDPTTPVYSTTSQHQPVALILQSPNFSSTATPMPISCPSHVTFLITSPASQSTSSTQQPSQVNTGATLKIPAYIPRSTTGSDGVIIPPANFSSVTTDEIVGDGQSYSGPATLTLHRDVDALQPQSYYQSQQQVPPAITIQYHHSAPATPLMEALSPYGNIKPEENSLDLLATVAQEFGSREDLGKRLSIDGSCNNSIIGESPPMSPQKSLNYPPVMVKYQYQKPSMLVDNEMSEKSSKKKVKSPKKMNSSVSGRVSPTGNISKGEKKEKLLSKPKSTKKGKEKTTNSIVMKQKQVKAGKKQKRSVSDSAASNPPPVVFLKIPQFQQRPMLSPTALSKRSRKKAKMSASKGKKVVAFEMSTDSSAGLLSINKQQQNEKKRKIKLKSDVEGINKSDKTKGKMKKAIKAVALPHDPFIGKVKAKKAKLDKNNQKKLDKKMKVPLISPSTSPIKLTTDPVTISSPTKVVKPLGATTSLHNPPERISAFAKQAIARRDSVVATSSTSQPKRPTSANSDTILHSPVCAGTELQNCHSSDSSSLPAHPTPQSPTIKMPQLTPFDVEPSSQHSDTVPMMMRFPSSAPPPLLPSVSTEKKKKNELDVSEFQTSVQDNKTDFALRNRSPFSCSKKGTSLKSKKFMNGGVTEVRKTKRRKSEGKEPGLIKDKTAKIDKKRRKSMNMDVLNKKAKPMKEVPMKRKSSSSKDKVVGSQLQNIPKITITPSAATGTTGGGTNCSSQYLFPLDTCTSFSPLTPPPTAKVPSDEDGVLDMNKRTLSRLNVTGASTPTSSRRSSSSLQINEKEGEAETSENENDLNNIWVADPLFAVSAIKLSNSCQPSDASSVGEEDDSFLVNVEDIEETRDDDDPIDIKNIAGISSGDKSHNKISSCIKNLSNQSYPRTGSEEHKPERDRFLEVKTQLKAFVHFTPKQLKGNKKCYNIKPCLKAEPVVRSHSEPDEIDGNEDLEVEEDEDLALDMEVAKITKKVHSKKPRNDVNSSTSSTTATSVSTSMKKPSINRNSFSYLSNSSSKTLHPPAPPLSTKEIMTKVFSRKVSPELGEKKRKQQKRQKTMKKRHLSGTEMDADDEDDEEDEAEMTDVEDFASINKLSSNPQLSISAAATAIVMNNSSNLSSTSTATVATATKKTPKKRSTRSSTTSSSTSTKSTSRGNRGQVLSMTSTPCTSSSIAQTKDEVMCPGKVELDSVEELVDEMRILTEIQGLFYTGRLNALQPPDVYGVTLDNERGAPPHLIFSAEEVLEKCLREKKPQKMTSGLRICAYWSPQYSGLYPGRVSSDFNPKFDPELDLIPIEFDDGDTGMIKLKEIRLLSVNHPVREYDPNPLLTLEKKHRKRRHSSATGTSGGCTGDHEEPDCGEPYCAKIEKLNEEDDEEDDDDLRGRHTSSKMLYWTWSGLGYKRPQNKKNRNKEFFHGIQRGNEAINVGDSALFISTGNERPFIGRVERFWERKGKKMVNVRWFYHPEEVKASAKRLSNLKYPGALFESPHIDENDVQTIAKKCDVLPFPEFKQRLSSGSNGSPRLAKLSAKSSSKPRDMYYVAGYYDPYTYNLTLKDLK